MPELHRLRVRRPTRAAGTETRGHANTSGRTHATRGYVALSAVKACLGLLQQRIPRKDNKRPGCYRYDDAVRFN